MKEVKRLKVVQFDSIEELKEFVCADGHAEYYNGFEGDYIPIRYDENYGEDGNGGLVIGSDAWIEVEPEHLDSIYGFIVESY